MEKPSASIQIIILAGGLSSRMGRDKSRIRIGRRTMLGHIRATAAQLKLPVRVLRRDAVPRCGPIGGIYTALARTRADALLFLACDMPFVTPTFLKQMLRDFRSTTAKFSTTVSASFAPTGGEGRDEGVRAYPKSSNKSPRRESSLPLLGERAGVRAVVPKTNFPPALFSSHKNLFGLPCLIHRDSLPLIARQIANKKFSLQSLARALQAKPLTPLRQPARQLLNLNTPNDLEIAQRHAVPEAGAPVRLRPT